MEHDNSCTGSDPVSGLKTLDKSKSLRLFSSFKSEDFREEGFFKSLCFILNG